jgi:uncharacterized Zn-binding protein involved in type VI secretion
MSMKRTLARGSRGARRAGRSMAMAAIGAVLVLLGACEEAPVSARMCEAGIVAGDLVITEVFADPAGADEGREWFELFNATGRAVELSGVTITSSKADGSRARTHVIAAASVAADGYLVLGNALPELAPAHVGHGYGTELGELFNGEGGKLSLSCGGMEIDSVRYERVRSGRARAFDGGVAPDALANDEAPRWCDAASTYEAEGYGTPGARNDDCEVVIPGRCIDRSDGNAQRDTVPVAPGDLVITELLPDPTKVADALGEWIEVLVRRDVDLNGMSVDRVGDSSAPAVVAAETCLRVTAGSYAILARSADAAFNGGLPRVDAILPLSLVSGSVASPGDVQLLAGTALIDGVRWTRSSAGKSLQVDPRYLEPSANDDERVSCDGQEVYGDGDRGSPGAANSRCLILPPAGMCDQGGTFRTIRKPAGGQLVITEYIANPSGVDSEEEWFELANVGSTSFDLNGLGIDRTGDTAPASLILAADCKPVSAGGFAVLARSADAAKNGGLPRADATYTLSMGDAGNLQILDGAALLDGISWTDAPSNASAQLDRSYTTPSGNDAEAHFCAATTPYGTGTNKGSPGAANARCP